MDLFSLVILVQMNETYLFIDHGLILALAEDLPCIRLPIPLGGIQ
jgi:hypothetical protein